MYSRVVLDDSSSTQTQAANPVPPAVLTVESVPSAYLLYIISLHS